MPFVVVEF